MIVSITYTPKGNPVRCIITREVGIKTVYLNHMLTHSSLKRLLRLSGTLLQYSYRTSDKYSVTMVYKRVRL